MFPREDSGWEAVVIRILLVEPMNLLRGALACFGLRLEDRHVRAFACESHRDRAADA